MKLEEKVIAVIRENSERLENIPPDADLQDDLGIDSFGTIMIVNGIEDAFSITIDEADLKKIRTISDIVRILHEHYGVKEDEYS